MKFNLIIAIRVSAVRILQYFDGHLVHLPFCLQQVPRFVNIAIHSFSYFFSNLVSAVPKLTFITNAIFDFWVLNTAQIWATLLLLPFFIFFFLSMMTFIKLWCFWIWNDSSLWNTESHASSVIAIRSVWLFFRNANCNLGFDDVSLRLTGFSKLIVKHFYLEILEMLFIL